MADTDLYIGKHLLVGLTRLDANGDVTEQVQLHGTILRITHEGILMRQPDGEEFSLPPDVDSLKPAPPGHYRLRSSGEVVINPDYISSWTASAPPQPKGT